MTFNPISSDNQRVKVFVECILIFYLLFSIEMKINFNKIMYLKNKKHNQLVNI